MAKKAVKKVQSLNTSSLRVTIYFGYGLFLMAAVLLLITVAPWFSSTGPNAFNEYTLMLVASFAIAALVPPAVGYFVGDRASRSKSKEIHHYNGVLFGIAGFWLANALTTIAGATGAFGFVNSMELHVLTGLIPVVLTALILGALGVAYAKQARHQVPIDDYVPFRAMLAVSIVAIFATYLVLGLIDIAAGSDVWSSLAVFILPTVMIAGFVVLSMLAIGKKAGTIGERTTKGLVVVSYALVAITFIGQIVTALNIASQDIALISFGVGLSLWLAYTLSLRRFSAAKQKAK